MNSTGRNRKKPGLPSGSLLYTRERMQEHVTFQLLQYNAEEVAFYENLNLKDVLKKIVPGKVNWVNVNGMHDTAIIEKIGDHFKIHPLILEDISHTDHMPKLEDHDHYLFLTLKMLTYNESVNKINQEQVSMILGDNYVFTFQEVDGDIFDSVREGIRSGKGRLRRHSTDYLFYRLIDTVVDHYFILCDRTEENLEGIEEMLLKGRSDNVSEKILHEMKNIIFLRRCIFPLREEIRKLRQKESQLINESTYTFFDDVFDHLMHLSHTLDSFRELITSLMELHMAMNSNRMNNVMKTLTIFAAIFMPLTFIAGIYGMNFQFMPELEWPWGYPLILLLMATVAISMLVYMKRRNWM